MDKSNFYYGGTFTNAVFMNKEQTLIHAYYKATEESAPTRIVVDLVDNTDEMARQAVFNAFTIDELVANTNEYEKALRRERHNIYIEEALQRGLVYDPSKVEPNKALSFDWVFELPEGTAGHDFLFELKLRLFDLPAVSESNNYENKKKLRDATNPIDAIYYAGKLIHE